MDFQTFGENKGLGIVLLPGLFAAGWIWEDVKKELVEYGYAGAILNSAFAEITPKGDALAYLQAEIEKTVQQLNFDKYIVCGNSLGGLLALKIHAAKNINSVGAIVSGSPGFGKTSDLGLSAKRFFSLTDAEYVSSLLFSNKDCVTKEQMGASLKYFSKRKSLLNIAKYMKNTNDVNIDSILKNLNDNVMLIWGANDNITSTEGVKKKISINDHLYLEMISNCGHSPMLEKPKDFSFLMDQYIKKTI